MIDRFYYIDLFLIFFYSEIPLTANKYAVPFSFVVGGFHCTKFIRMTRQSSRERFARKLTAEKPKTMKTVLTTVQRTKQEVVSDP